MEIVIKKTIPRDVLENIFVTALEGGSNYWYTLSDDALKLIRAAVPKSKEKYISIAILEAILDHGVEVPINDAENEEDVLGYISSKTMQERFQVLFNDLDSSWALSNELEGNGDASSSDIIFQFMVMGEVVFG